MSSPVAPPLPPGSPPPRKRPSALASGILLVLILVITGGVIAGGVFAFKMVAPESYSKVASFFRSEPKVDLPPPAAPPAAPPTAPPATDSGSTPQVAQNDPPPTPEPTPAPSSGPDPLTTPVNPDPQPDPAAATVASTTPATNPEPTPATAPEMTTETAANTTAPSAETLPEPDGEGLADQLKSPATVPAAENQPDFVEADPIVAPEPVQSFAEDTPEVLAMKAEADRRIDEAPAELYSEADKDRVREAIRLSKNLTRVATLQFGTGSMALGAREKARFRKALLTQEAENLMNDPQAVFFIIGYADSTGTSAVNRALSQKRAASVEETLKSFKVPNQTYSVGIGSTDLISAQDQSKNRAVEVWIVLP